ncbi:MAG: radical SAM protein [Deltaproteobacteria bacterium]|nr:radical SAM protein [Deltaproteobacteria bacterium]
MLAHSPEALTRTLGGPGRAQAVLGLLRRGRDPFTEGELARSARARLALSCTPTTLKVAEAHDAPDQTVKLLVELEDARRVEMVVIPARDRTTLCVSSQVGCARGCRFCATAAMGLVRNLRADEISGQVFIGLRAARDRGLPAVRNVVLMGMGEPLDNGAEVAQALSLIAVEDGLGIGRRHVTVSTVGPSPAAILSTLAWPAHLAWSLHAADDALRRRLVPTQRHSVEALRDAFAEVLAARREPLFVEIALVDGWNDDLEAAQRASALFRGFPAEVRINLLPMNPIDGPLTGSAPDRVTKFRDALIAEGYFCTVRRARGAVERAACGQLATRDRRAAAPTR